jgi:hypothetical protein
MAWLRAPRSSFGGASTVTAFASGAQIIDVDELQQALRRSESSGRRLKIEKPTLGVGIKPAVLSHVRQA